MLSNIDELINHLKIKEFDLLLIGDGSGTTIDTPCGWSCIYYEKEKQKIMVLTGTFSNGTNNYAELAPYIHGLWYHSYKNKPCKVSIVSDSQLTIRCGTGEYTRNANLSFWASIDFFKKIGYEVSWHYIKRNLLKINELADTLAKNGRLMAEKFNVSSYLPNG